MCVCVCVCVCVKHSLRGRNLSPDPCWVGVLLELLVELLEELELLDPPLGAPPGRDTKRSTLSHSTLGSAALHTRTHTHTHTHLKRVYYYDHFLHTMRMC